VKEHAPRLATEFRFAPLPFRFPPFGLGAGLAGIGPSASSGTPAGRPDAAIGASDGLKSADSVGNCPGMRLALRGGFFILFGFFVFSAACGVVPPMVAEAGVASQDTATCLDKAPGCSSSMLGDAWASATDWRLGAFFIFAGFFIFWGSAMAGPPSGVCTGDRAC
jgi:hypothetical protein